jgi:ABC-type phosphate transport system auxiliary subunit
MERLVNNQRHVRFAAANCELREFRYKVDELAGGKETITERDLQALSQRLEMLSPEVGDASRASTLDKALQDELGNYVVNLRALQSALEKVRCIMLARKLQLESSRRHLHSVQGWVNAYGHTT